MARKKVFVSGCFDMLHSGHIRFLESVAAYGDIYVGIGSDKTIQELKGREAKCAQEERKYTLEALRYVKACHINSGCGIMDFANDLQKLAPDYFIVNEDGHTPAKARLCRRLGIKYVVLKRDPRPNLPPRSTSGLRSECLIPYRLDLAGGWLDQPYVSKLAPGPVLTICIEPTFEFKERCGMASSSRRRAIELWETAVPRGDPEHLAKILFSYENPPGTKTFSGSQDAIGIVFPGLNRLDYNGGFWPKKITSIKDANILHWLEKHLCLVEIGPRKATFDVCEQTKITAQKVKRLAIASDHCWEAIQDMNLDEFGRYMRESFEAQVSLFPRMMTKHVQNAIRQHGRQALGWKLSGAGGGGYLVLVSNRVMPNTIKANIRRLDI
jgi:cytidyltransferase-like protein